MNGEMLRRDVRIAALIVGPLVVAGLVALALATSGNGFDAYSYWRAPHGASLYAGTDVAGGPAGTFRYSPAFAQAVSPLWWLPWPAFVATWTALLVGAYLAIVPRRYWLAALAFPPVAFELYIGNVHLLLALAIVASFRWPAAWSFVLLTKVTPGVGVLWYVVRREWRSLGIALAATAAIVAASVLVGGVALWRDWIGSLEHSQSSGNDRLLAWLPPLVVRLPLAAALVVWGARTDRRWVLPIAATLALPSIWLHGLSLLVACLPLREPVALRDVDVDRRRNRARGLHIAGVGVDRRASRA